MVYVSANVKMSIQTISFDLRYLTHKTYKGIWLPSQIPVYCNFSSFSVVLVVPSCISVALMWRPMLTCPGLLPSLSSPLGRHHFGLCLPPSGWAISSASPGPKLGSQDVRKPPLCGGRWPEAYSSSNWHCHPWLISACPCVFFCEVIFVLSIMKFWLGNLVKDRYANQPTVSFWNEAIRHDSTSLQSTPHRESDWGKTL